MPSLYKGKPRATRGKNMQFSKPTPVVVVKKKNKKKLNNTKLTANLGRGLPERMKTILVYSDFITMSPGLVPATYHYSCNGIFDPNTTGGGHQPMYFDQLMVLYDHYHVIGSKLTCKFYYNNPTSTSIPVIVGTTLDDNATVANLSITDWEEEQRSSSSMLTSQRAFASFTKKWSAKKNFGGSVLANNDLQGNISANPTEQTYYRFFAQPVDQSTTVSIGVQVRIEYITIFGELRDLSGS